jgi:hypothetical protein
MQQLPKSVFIFIFCVPLAVLLGFMLATPLDRTALAIVFGVFLVLLTPILLTTHHIFLIVMWNAYIDVYFLPGQPYMWMLATLVSAFLSILTRTVNRGRMPFLNVSSVTWSLIAIGLVSFLTSQLTGGVGAQAMGSDIYGGKRYFYLWCAILGYFAMSSIPVDPNKRQMLAGLFFLSSITSVAGNITLMLGEKFYILFLLFPVEWAMAQASSEYEVGGITRVAGLGPASLAAISFLLVRYGIRGTFAVRRPWRGLAFLACIAAGLLSGFRSILILTVTLMVVQFFIEGLHRTKYLFIFGLVGALTVTLMVPFAKRLPLSAQRCLTMLPLDLDRGAIEIARGSTDWRIEMWRFILPDVPKYLWVGKGYAIDPKDLYFAQQNISVRTYAPFETALVAGDYHNGPLSLIIPFGVWGVLAFVWFSAASLRLLWRNFKYGEESIRNINGFLLASFIAKLFYFLFVFGAFYMDLSTMVGIVALSVSFNRGMAARVLAPARVPVAVAEPQASPAPVPVPAWQPAFARRIQTW